MTKSNINQNYVDLISLRARRKPINKHGVQSQVKTKIKIINRLASTSQANKVCCKNCYNLAVEIKYQMTELNQNCGY